jgi:hypothetical protein
LRARLGAYTTNDLLFGHNRLVFQEKVILEGWEVGVEVIKYSDLRNRIRVEVNQLNLVMLEKAAK